MAGALTLVIANKNYSSWSMRPWVALRGCGIAFSERLLKFHSPEWDRHIGSLSPSRLVPVLWEGTPGAGFATWDTLAIIERDWPLIERIADELLEVDELAYAEVEALVARTAS